MQKPLRVKKIKRLIAMYDDNKSKEEIYKHFKRWLPDIEARLVKLGKIKNRYEF